ncbi:MAG: GntR family transcriptional regulator [Curvibacter sp.]|nr:GntR family transcriptional regulator [Curvibacter sp.]
MPRAPKSSASPSVAPPVPASGAVAGSHSIDSIAQDIATAIIEKRLPPGTWLREEALGRVYAVSRTKIRAALLMLSKDKLIEIIPDKGSFVSQPTVQEAREIFGLRRLLEAEAVRQFIAVARRADFAALQQHIRFERNTLGSAPTTGTVREKLLGDFHVVLAEASGNATLAGLVKELVGRSSLIAMLYHSSNDPHCSSDEHEALLALCRSGDVEAAVSCMTEHLTRIESGLQLSQDRNERQLDLVKALLA